MDVFPRRTIGFAVEPAPIDGVSICRMFSRTIAGRRLPRYDSNDHDPLFRFHRWLANLRVLEIEEITSVPYTPGSHPVVERLIGTIRREYLDRVFVWNATDLLRRLDAFKHCCNAARVHRGLAGVTRAQRAGVPTLLPPRWFTAFGGSIAGACFRSRAPLDYEFANCRGLDRLCRCRFGET